MRRAHCGAWLEVASSPALVQRLWAGGGGSGAFLWVLWLQQGGYLLDLAIGRYSCQSCQYVWTQEQSCTNTQTRREGKKEITRARKWHLNYGGMLYKISRTFFGKLLLLQSSFSPLTPGVPQSHTAFWLLPEHHKRGRLTCLPTRVWRDCVIFFFFLFPSRTGKLLLLQLQN